MLLILRRFVLTLLLYTLNTQHAIFGMGFAPGRPEVTVAPDICLQDTIAVALCPVCVPLNNRWEDVITIITLSSGTLVADEEHGFPTHSP